MDKRVATGLAVGGVLLLLAIIGVVVYFTVFHNAGGGGSTTPVSLSPSSSFTTATTPTPTAGTTLASMWEGTTIKGNKPPGPGPRTRPPPPPGPGPGRRSQTSGKGDDDNDPAPPPPPQGPVSDGTTLKRLYELSGAGYCTDIVSMNDGSNRVFLVGKTGKIAVGDPATGKFDAFMDIQVNIDNEAGLLGMAPHPQYETNGFFFLKYAVAGKIAIARGKANANLVSAPPSSVQVLLTVDHLGGPSHHWGGNIRFGPDNLLYIIVGDTTAREKARDKGALQGKILRIEVGTDEKAGYKIPAANPNPASPVLHYGLRNPYSISFSSDGVMWVAIVGEQREMLHRFAPGDKDQNLGWPDVECAPGCERPGIKEAAFAWDLDSSTYGRAMIGGCMYDGARYPSLRNCYVFAGFNYDAPNNLYAWNSASNQVKKIATAPGPVSRISQHVDGSILVGTRNGTVYVLV